MKLPWKKSNKVTDSTNEERRKPENALKRVDHDHKVETQRLLALAQEQTAETARRIAKLRALGRLKGDR